MEKMNALNLFDVLNGTADTSNKTQSAEDVKKRLQEGSLLNKVSDIIKGDEYGKSKYSKKINSGYSKGIYRDKNSGFYWNGFFSNSSDKKAGFNDKMRVHINNIWWIYWIFKIVWEKMRVWE